MRRLLLMAAIVTSLCVTDANAQAHRRGGKPTCAERFKNEPFTILACKKEPCREQIAEGGRARSGPLGKVWRLKE